MPCIGGQSKLLDSFYFFSVAGWFLWLWSGQSNPMRDNSQPKKKEKKKKEVVKGRPTLPPPKHHVMPNKHVPLMYVSFSLVDIILVDVNNVTNIKETRVLFILSIILWCGRSHLIFSSSFYLFNCRACRPGLSDSVAVLKETNSYVQVSNPRARKKL